MQMLNLVMVAKLIGLVLSINVVLSAFSKFLDVLAGAVPAPGVIKVDTAMQKVVAFMKPIVDFLSANMPH